MALAAYGRYLTSNIRHSGHHALARMPPPPNQRLPIRHSQVDNVDMHKVAGVVGSMPASPCAPTPPGGKGGGNASRASSCICMHAVGKFLGRFPCNYIQIKYPSRTRFEQSCHGATYIGSCSCSCSCPSTSGLGWSMCRVTVLPASDNYLT